MESSKTIVVKLGKRYTAVHAVKRSASKVRMQKLAKWKEAGRNSINLIGTGKWQSHFSIRLQNQIQS